jgi:hypothetical protein
MSHRIVKRGNITYYLSDTAVIVGVGGYQYISYNIYNSPSRSSLLDFKKRIIASKENQYNNVVEQMDLAQKCKLIGTSTTKPDWEEE